MFPNPTSDWLRFDVGVENLSLIEVYDQQGRLLQREEYPVNNEINISSLPASIYVVVAELENKQRVSALVKKQ